ncbi:MAG: hypothetical protein BGO80_16180 [Devosia sp. 63-57]|nr:MAG: hypothetical protein ABS74_13690 [Pelagibacterium sp. SCN 63-126]ODU87011.1 MAG: hypothetical protein ABT14_06100 [Pelagibacterium sp. SCN 63-17]OJX42958.1 MAG: hypothetical protein BGO80_16180 [Devosia sp. 63-57]
MQQVMVHLVFMEPEIDRARTRKQVKTKKGDPKAALFALEAKENWSGHSARGAVAASRQDRENTFPYRHHCMPGHSTQRIHGNVILQRGSTVTG